MNEKKSRTPLGERIARAAYARIETIHATDGSKRQEIDAAAVAQDVGTSVAEVQEVLDEIFGLAAPAPKAVPIEQTEEEALARQIEDMLVALAPHRRVKVLRILVSRFNLDAPRAS
jgi:hypothetical protein